jgi:hypothetical protein
VSRRLIASLFLVPLLATAAAALAPVPAAARVYSGSDRDVPLARFQDPLCPGIIGVELVQAETMVGLIRQNAAEVGLRLADPQTCEPNLVVAVMDDPEGYLDGLRKRKSYLFDWLENAERRALFDTPGPAHGWTQVVNRSRDGMPIYPTRSLTDVPHTQMMAAHSLIYVPTRRDIVSSMVLIDKKAVQGLTVGQLAAYATMRGLAGDQAGQLAAPRESILGLFGEAAKPAGLTRSDKIFLQTLYSTMPNNPAAITLALADTRIAGNE